MTDRPIETPPASASTRRLPGWMHEPLLHFLLIGAALFVADHLLAGQKEDPRVILLSAQEDARLKEVFKGSRNRDPSAAELKALRDRWLDNEVLYREGLALQVDRGDAAIRDRVIFKSLSVVDANTKLPPFDDKLLKEWFEKRRDKYDEPARYDFQEAVLVGDNTETAVRTFVQALNRGAPGDAQAGLRVFKGRPHANLVQTYGEEFAQALETAPVGAWQAYRTSAGWRAMRLEAVSPAKPAVFEALRGVILQDWTDVTMAEQRTAAVRALAKKYIVRIEEASI